MQLKIGERKLFALIANTKDGGTRPAKPESVNVHAPFVATALIEDTGVWVTAIGPGHCRVDVVAEGLTTYVDVDVTDPDAGKAVSLALVEPAAAETQALAAGDVGSVASVLGPQ